MNAIKHLLEGDLLKTSPARGFWGCAVVLKAPCRPVDDEMMSSMCHIGITSHIQVHDFVAQELDVTALDILEVDQEIRRAPNDYVPHRSVPAIGIYTNRINRHVQLLGSIDALGIYCSSRTPLSWEVGDGTDGGWPLCGEVSARLGYEAVHAWRSIHDRDRWLADRDEARAETEARLSQFKNERGRGN
jgi:hypothetical protein